MRVLIITKEVWRDDQNGGNTLTWMFSRFPEDIEIAQVYCSEGKPDNNVCRNYYKLSTRDIVRAIRYNKGQDAGTPFILNLTEADNTANVKNRKRYLSTITNSEVLRDFIWKTGVFKSKKLKDYILSFDPDIIYAPGYGVNYMNYLIHWICSFVNCPVVSLISDDYYSFHQRRINPLFWIGLIRLRHNVRKSVNCYDLIYTMTDVQKKQLEKDFSVPVKIMRKGYSFNDEMIENRKISDPIRIIHVGNIYYNRWKTLSTLGKCIKDINVDKEKYKLEIVTSYGMSDEIRSSLENNGIIIHNNVSSEELRDLYKSCDIAVHVEGFDFINRLKMRMSFSTKIIEYLASGCAIVMICDKRQSTYRYMEEHKLAVLIDDEKKIKDTLARLYSNKEEILSIRNKAFAYGKANHSVEMVSKKMWEDFTDLIMQKA